MKRSSTKAANMLDLFAAAVKEAVEEHLREGRAVPVWQDGKMIYIKPKGNKEI